VPSGYGRRGRPGHLPLLAGPPVAADPLAAPAPAHARGPPRGHRRLVVPGRRCAARVAGPADHLALRQLGAAHDAGSLWHDTPSRTRPDARLARYQATSASWRAFAKQAYIGACHKAFTLELQGSDCLHGHDPGGRTRRFLGRRVSSCSSEAGRGPAVPGARRGTFQNDLITAAPCWRSLTPETDTNHHGHQRIDVDTDELRKPGQRHHQTIWPDMACKRSRSRLACARRASRRRGSGTSAGNAGESARPSPRYLL
jgi:hypothetical protein